ncbi:MAG: helix-turn-helix transcriptional regulator [Mycobacteriales bacterium]
MPQGKSERLVNLTMALMATSRFVTVEEISRLVDGYDPPGGDVTDAAFRRMFERDKEQLRELGIPVETGPVDPLYGDDLGYRIRRSDYALPPLQLEPDEAAALGLAARFWSSAELASASASALRKLAAGGVDAVTPVGFEARVDAADPAFAPLTEAVRARRAVTFPYRRPGADETRRRLEPWGVVSRRRNWYVVGLDRDRGAERVFRLSRITGPVEFDGDPGAYPIPDGVDLRAAVSDAAPSEPTATARIRLAGGVGTRLRRRGTVAGDVLELPYADDERLAEELLGYGPGAVVLEPPSLRDEVVRRLRALVGSAP